MKLGLVTSYRARSLNSLVFENIWQLNIPHPLSLAVNEIRAVNEVRILIKVTFAASRHTSLRFLISCHNRHHRLGKIKSRLKMTSMPCIGNGLARNMDRL